MTDEEMAEEYKADYGIDLCCLCRECDVETLYPCQHKIDAMHGYKDGFLAGLKAGRDVKIMELEQQIEKMKRHCNCKHRDSEGYCEVKRTYLIDLSYDGCDKWELED